VLGAIPIFAALLGLILGTERPSGRFWLAAAISFVGVALVAAGAAGTTGDLDGILLGLATGATWAAYSVIIAPLMRTYSPYRISAVVVPAAWVLIALAGIPAVEEQDWDLGWEVWALLLFATLGPLVLTNVLWFRSIHRIGPARATLATNLQPFVAAVLAVILLSEPLSALQVAGGVLIASGIFLARRRTPAPQAP
jgi:DME family drug/metabolite transporter